MSEHKPSVSTEGVARHLGVAPETIYGWIAAKSLAARENLHAKCAVTGADIEAKRDAAAAKLKGFLGKFGYARV